jgi:ureidoacrylate peracid hydrolase
MAQVTWAIEPERTALVVVDMQNDFVQEGAPLEVPQAQATVERLNRLIETCRAHAATVIFVRHVLRADRADAGRLIDMHAPIRERRAIVADTEGVELYPKLDVRPDDIVVTKSRYSAFYGTELDPILRTKAIDTVIIGGTVTQVCCDSTAKDAFSRDYKVIFLSDGTSNRGLPDMGWGPLSPEEVQRVVLSTITMSFGQVASVHEVVAALKDASAQSRPTA